MPPIAVIGGNKTQIDAIITGIVLDKQNDVYVSLGLTAPGGGKVLKYAAGGNGNVPPIAIIAGDQTRLSGWYRNGGIAAKRFVWARFDPFTRSSHG